MVVSFKMWKPFHDPVGAVADHKTNQSKAIEKNRHQMKILLYLTVIITLLATSGCIFPGGRGGRGGGREGGRWEHRDHDGIHGDRDGDHGDHR